MGLQRYCFLMRMAIDRQQKSEKTGKMLGNMGKNLYFCGLKNKTL
jgi:hypothetical protein